MMKQNINLLFTAVHHIQHACRRTGLHKQLCQAVRRQRILLRRLQYKGIAAGNGQRKHPQRDHSRKIKRGDAGAYSQRLNIAGGIYVTGNVFNRFAHHQGRHVHRLFNHFNTAPYITFGIVKGLAGLAGKQCRQFVMMRFQ